MLLVLFGLAVIAVAIVVLRPAHQHSGIANIAGFLIVALAGAVGAVVFAQNYHLPPSDADKAVVAQEAMEQRLVEYVDGWTTEALGADALDESGQPITHEVTVGQAPTADELLAGGTTQWNVRTTLSNGEFKEFSWICSAGENFPDETAPSCVEATVSLESEGVDFSGLNSGH